MVASSISITGMSSLIGYTRLHVAHLSAAPFLTSVTGVLQLGQARISSNSGSTGIHAIYDTFPLLWNNSPMKSLIVAAFCVAVPISAAGQSRVPSATDRPGEAYEQFLLAHRLAEHDDEAGAIAAYKRAMALDPQAADIPAELADLYLQSNKIQEAKAAAEQAAKIEPNNRDANRVLGIVYAALSDSDRQTAPRGRGDARPEENLAKAIHHLESAVEPAVGADPHARATLARLYLRAESYGKAIPLLSDLVAQESSWQDGPMLLAEAYAGAGRIADGIAWMEMHAEDDPRLLPTLGDFSERQRRGPDAPQTHPPALPPTPPTTPPHTR